MLEGALYLELVTSTIEVDGVFVCTGATRVKVHPVFYILFYYPVFYYRGEVSPGARLLDLVAEGAFVLWSLELLL